MACRPLDPPGGTSVVGTLSKRDLAEDTVAIAEVAPGVVVVIDEETAEVPERQREALVLFCDAIWSAAAPEQEGTIGRVA